MALAAAVARKTTTMRYFFRKIFRLACLLEQQKSGRDFLDKEYINAYNISRRAAQKIC